jgi:redox-sensitive bicupin YhaK (pirin superfamily)
VSIYSAGSAIIGSCKNAGHAYIQAISFRPFGLYCSGVFMLHHYPYAGLGAASFGWLEARHHFSFGQYQDPQKTGFGDLLVINDDIIQPKSGFAPHGHSDMEIITYVRRGAISHEDSQGNKGRTGAGDVQVMSAGTGIRHSEYNLEEEETNLFQIWIAPDESGLPPRWDAAEFPKGQIDDQLPLLVSGDGQAPLHINNRAAKIYAGRLGAGQSLTHKLAEDLSLRAYLLVSDGTMLIEDIEASKGDGVSVEGRTHIEIAAREPSEILVIELGA